MIKKTISLILSLIMIFSVFPSVLAAENRESEKQELHDANGTAYFISPTSQLLPENESILYDRYEIQIGNIPAKSSYSSTTVIQSILNLCDRVNNETIGQFNLVHYTSNQLHRYLYNCREITDITSLDGYLYIFYNTYDCEEIILCYDDTGLDNKVIYTPGTDTAIVEQNNSTLSYRNFRANCSYVVSDEVIKEIVDAVACNDIEALSSIQNVDYYFDAEGNLIATPLIPLSGNTRATTYVGFTNESAMLADLKKDFPYQTQNLVSVTSKYSSLLQKNLTVKVTTLRDSYVRKSVNWSSFAANTTFSVIASTLGFTSINPVSIMLTALDIAVSTAQTILEEIKLANSAVYKYRSGIQGRVYDTVTWNDYVLVNSCASSSCEFTGGYNNSGIFTWIISYTPSSINYSSDYIANQAVSWYQNHVYYDGECTLYYPYP